MATALTILGWISLVFCVVTGTQLPGSDWDGTQIATGIFWIACAVLVIVGQLLTLAACEIFS